MQDFLSFTSTDTNCSKTNLNFKRTWELVEFPLTLKKFDESPDFLGELLNRVALCRSLIPSFEI